MAAQSHPAAAAVVLAWLERERARVARRPFVLGIAGAQGSGKSTLAANLAESLRAAGTAAALLSLDDLYLDRAARADLAERVHPLLATRGVPGTHHVARGLALIDALGRGEAVALPRFDKARDAPGDPEPPVHADLLILEGWCLGARPQSAEELAAPVNALERDADPDGVWRRFVNAQLAGPYRALFDRIDRLVLLAAPGFEVVAGWRIEQERGLRASGRGGMTDDEVRGFVLHYQRITEALLRDGPATADLVLRLDAKRRVATG